MPAPASGMSTRSLAPISHTGRAILAVRSNASCAELGQIIQADLKRIGLHLQLRPYAGAIASATSRPGPGDLFPLGR
jgi:hypothetical protein